MDELGGWLAGNDPSRVLTAEQKLLQIADTDNRTVAAAARAYLTDLSQANTRISPRSYGTTQDQSTASAPAEKVPGSARRVSDRAARLLADAERTAQSITDEGVKALAMSEIAQVLTATNPDHAARVLADAERTAQPITGEGVKASVLSMVAQGIGSHRPGPRRTHCPVDH